VNNPRGLRLAVIVLAALSFSLAVVAAWLSANSGDDSGRDAAVRRTAGAMATAFLTYDYRHLPAHNKQVLALSTGTFKKQYQSSFSGFEQLYKATKQVSKVREVAIYLNDVTASEATAIARVDFVVSGVSGDNRPLTVFLEMSLIHSDPGWRVDSVSAINTDSGTPTSAPTSTTPE
jgi:hypothetical protein